VTPGAPKKPSPDRWFWRIVAGFVVVVVITVGAFVPSQVAPIAMPVFDPLYSSHMVLQRGRPIAFRGWATGGKPVTVVFDGETIATEVVDGHWEVVFAPREAGGPHEVRATSPNGESVLTDVLVGDVWLCAGQSNMVWPVEDSDGGEWMIAESSPSSRVRLLRLDETWSHTRLEDVPIAGPERTWTTTTPETVAPVSAVAYSFGRAVSRESGVPIGLIQAAHGSTPIRAWVPINTLRDLDPPIPGLLEPFDMFNATDEQLEASLVAADGAHADFLSHVWNMDEGVPGGWGDPGFDDSGWRDVTLPGRLDRSLGLFEGVLWLRKTIELPAGV